MQNFWLKKKEKREFLDTLVSEFPNGVATGRDGELSFFAGVELDAEDSYDVGFKPYQPGRGMAQALPNGAVFNDDGSIDLSGAMNTGRRFRKYGRSFT